MDLTEPGGVSQAKNEIDHSTKRGQSTPWQGGTEWYGLY